MLSGRRFFSIASSSVLGCLLATKTLTAQSFNELRIVPLPPVDEPAVLRVEYLEPQTIASETLAAEPVPVGPRPLEPAPLRLNLFSAIETGLQQDPDLTALRRNEGVSVAALGVARTYPFNPFLQVQATPWQHHAGNGPERTYHYVLLMQQLQLGRQRRWRTENAVAALASVRWNIVQAELANVAQTERLYFTALYLRGLRELANEIAALNAQAAEAAERRLAAGDLSAADATVARLDGVSARRSAQLADANYRNALLDLARHLNLPPQSPLDPTASLTDFVWRTPPRSGDPDRIESERLVHDGLNPNATTDDVSVAWEWASTRPDVLAARAEVAAARANVGLARGSRIPDLQIGPYYQQSEGGSTLFGFRAQTDIPVVNNGLPLVHQREAELRRQAAVRDQIQTRAQLDSIAALDRYRRALSLATEAETNPTPSSSTPSSSTPSLPDELQRLERQFLAGEIDLIRVVTARTSFAQWRRAQLDLLNETAQAAAALTAATGIPPELLIVEKGSATEAR